MTRDQFIKQRRNEWKRFEVLLVDAEDRRTQRLTGDRIAEMAALFRGLCFDLSLVQSRDWGKSISDYLNNLVSRGHNCLYRSPPGSLRAMLQFYTADFPRLLRQNGWYFLIALFLFVVPGLISGIVCANNPKLTDRIVPAMQQRMMEGMYSKSVTEHSQASSAEARTGMAGFYVYNNVGIAFRCFAYGAFLGIGSVMVLVYNSIFLGTVCGFLIGKGYGANFLEFVIGHGSFELTAIVVSGGAGMIIGHALAHPGNRTRFDALRDRGRVGIKLAGGAGIMLAIAAIIEAFWSPLNVPFGVKITVGVILWLVVGWHLWFGGREQFQTTVPKRLADNPANI